jgi:DNA polymerase-3 subunit epsilon
MLQLTKPLAFIDLETTGVNLATDRIIEIAIVKVLPDGKRSVKRKLINPGCQFQNNQAMYMALLMRW